MIGTLLGSVHPDGSVDVRNSYAVPHNEQNGQVFVDVEFHRAMAELHGKVNPAERVVGWYSTGDGVVPTGAAHPRVSRAESRPAPCTSP